MDRSKQIDRILEEGNLDGFLMIETSDNANFYYLTKFDVHDPVFFLRTQGKSVLIVPPLEYARAQEEANVDKVINTAEFEDGDIRGDKAAKFRSLIKLLERYDIQNLALPRKFSLYKARKLEKEGYNVEVIEDVITRSRILKDQEEIKEIKEAQKVTEQLMELAERTIKKTSVRDDKLYLEGEILTSERLKAILHKKLLIEGFGLTDTVVACGKDSADPHNTGSGALKTDRPIIIDIFPQHPSKYHGDMTRTFVKGEVDSKVKEMRKAVLEAQEAAFEFLENKTKVTGEKLNKQVCEILEKHGFQTLRQGEIDSGFLHSAGHSIGLETHEPPRLGPSGGELKPGTVITIEPGLYDPEIGGVRIEDMILVTEEGYENFNSMHKSLEID